MLLAQKTLDIDNESIVCEYDLRETNALILHGAGETTNLKLFYRVAEALLKRGIGVVMFDYAGHGDSSGKLADSSLERRQRQAAGVIDQLLPPQSKFYAIGFSMSGQTVCDLLPAYGERIPTIVLLAPAIYAAEVHDLTFGSPDFTRILRTPYSWRTSRAPELLASYKGKVIIELGDNDEVIPEGVVGLLRQAHPTEYRHYPGATHKLTSWFNDHPELLESLVERLAEDGH
jgi:uncharacterized protein